MKKDHGAEKKKLLEMSASLEKSSKKAAKQAGVPYAKWIRLQMELGVVKSESGTRRLVRKGRKIL